MGNSGSVHHMQSGLKELHSYYQVQTTEDLDDPMHLREDSKYLKEKNSLEQEKYLPRSKYSRIISSSENVNQLRASDIKTKNSQIKVLPNVTENFRLRTTTNGAILQSGGTISGRKDQPIPQEMVLGRSKTFIKDTSAESLKATNALTSMPRRSQTQLNIYLGRRSTQNALNQNELHDQKTPYKLYTSKIDLKMTNNLDTDINNIVCDSNETFQKFSKVKKINKKRKAPPVPLTHLNGRSEEIFKADGHDINTSSTSERKQRLFKTKSETVFQTAIGAQNRHTSAPSHLKVATRTNVQPSPINLRSSYRSKINRNTTNPANTSYRREKSFDATLLTSRNNTFRDETIDYPRTTLIPTKPDSIQRATMPSLLRKTNPENENKEFKIELEAATKSRLLTRNANKKTASTYRQITPNNEKPKPVKSQIPLKTTKPDTQSKIPQLKKTFYFGMESCKRKLLDSSQENTINTFEDKLMENSAKNENISPKVLLASPPKYRPAAYFSNLKFKSETNDAGIQVNVRPTLPRRQLEIPRFSPVAAWRTLSEESKKQPFDPAGHPLSLNSAIESAKTFLTESRACRELCSDNKSGDSGISGDIAYLQEKPIQPTKILHMQNECNELVAMANLDAYHEPFLTPWTPQQDLDEEDSSSDGDLPMKLTESQSPTSAHIFSLSLPRENQYSLYADKNKPAFRSLQKLKRSMSGELNAGDCECTQFPDLNLFNTFHLGNYLSDNWVLSKNATALSNEKPIAYSNNADSNKKGSCLDLSASIQPMSLGCLATGRHLIYLPNRPIEEFKRQSTGNTSSDFPANNQNCQDDSRNTRHNFQVENNFSFQNLVRHVDQCQPAEELIKESERNEVLRKSELEAMRRVEEEFQRKRAHEKASIRHQLRLYSMKDDNFKSLPNQNCTGYRDDPDGAVSSISISPLPKPNETDEKNTHKRLFNTKYNESRRRNTMENEIVKLFENS